MTEVPPTELGELRTRTEDRIAALEATLSGIVATAAESAGDDEHDPEGQTVAYERAQTQALLAAARHDLAEVDAAQRRVAAGTYGRCERCDGAIPPARLQARPTARCCLRHA